MHYQLLVAVPGLVQPGHVLGATAELVNLYGDRPGEPGSGEWDSWNVGGRWCGSLTLTRHAANSGLGGPANWHSCPKLSSQRLELAAAFAEAEGFNRGNCARRRDIEIEQLIAPFYYIDLNTELHEIDYLDKAQATRQTSRFERWLYLIPGDTWLTNIDVHS